MPTVSIVMPAFNNERFIGQAIASALNQDFRDLELIVVDDCSTDGSAGIALAATRADNRVRMLRLEHNSGGSTAPKNRGIAVSTGTFISFLDSDDIDLPRKLTRALSVFRRYPETDVVFGDVIAMSEDGIPAAESTYNRASYSFVADAASYLSNLGDNVYQCCGRFFGFMVSGTLGISIQGAIIRRSALERLPYIFCESLRRNADMDLWFRLAETANMKYVDEPFAYYRHVRTSSTSDVRKTSLYALQVHRATYARLRDRLTRRELTLYRRRIAELLIGLGWLHRNDPSSSRKFYAESLSYRVTANGLRGSVVSAAKHFCNSLLDRKPMKA